MPGEAALRQYPTLPGRQDAKLRTQPLPDIPAQADANDFVVAVARNHSDGSNSSGRIMKACQSAKGWGVRPGWSNAVWMRA